MIYLPDNYDAYLFYERELERQYKLIKRNELVVPPEEEEEEC